MGNHDLIIETTDIMGRTQKIVIPYYISPTLLKPGLSEYSFSFGVQRHKYSQESNVYRNLVSSFDYERGINDYWTAAGHFEILNSRKYGTKASLGFTNKISLRDYGFLTLSFASNLHKFKESQQAMLSYAFSQKEFSAGATYSIFGKNFENSLLENPDKSTVKDRFSAQVSYGNADLGTFSLGYNSIVNRKSKTKRLVANYSKSVNSNQSMRISYDQNLLNKKDINISFSYNISIPSGNSNSHHFNTNITRSNNGDYRKNFNFSSNHFKTSGFRYSGQLSNDKTGNKYRFNVKKNTDHAKMEFNTAGGQDSQSYRFGLSGSVLWLDNQLFFAKPINSSVALVKVDGYEDFPVYYNNNLTTHTNKNGSAVLTSIAANTTSKVSIKGDKLKMNTHLRSPDLYIHPRWKSGTLVEFQVEQHKVLIAELVDESGEHLAENQQLIIEGIEEPQFSGYYGQVYMETIPKSLTKLEGTACDKNNKCCKFSAPIEDNEEDIMYDLGEILCRPLPQESSTGNSSNEANKTAQP